MSPYSEAQKHLACMALAWKRGNKPKFNSSEAEEACRKMMSSMSEEELRDYCSSPIKK
jgi:hypothetical protein